MRLRPPWAHPGAWHLESVARDGGGNDNIFFFFCQWDKMAAVEDFQ